MLTGLTPGAGDFTTLGTDFKLAVGNIFSNLQTGELEVFQHLATGCPHVALYQETCRFFQPQSMAVSMLIFCSQRDGNHIITGNTVFAFKFSTVPPAYRNQLAGKCLCKRPGGNDLVKLYLTPLRAVSYTHLR